MTVGELLERVGSSELAQWAVIFTEEDKELEELKNKGGR